MRFVVATTAVVTTALAFSVGTATGHRAPDHVIGVAPSPTTTASPTLRVRRPTPTPRLSSAALNGLIDTYCMDCHNDGVMSGNLSLEHYNVDSATQRIATSEKMIRKLRAHIMPLTGAARPGGDTLDALAAGIEEVIDKAARPNPGSRPFQRLNRPEYEAAIRDLVG